MRVNSAFDEIGLARGFSGFGYNSRPPTIHNDIGKINVQIKEEMDKKQKPDDLKVGQQSGIEDFVKQSVASDYFNKQSKRERKRRKPEIDE
jgi:hypothetical protein